LIQWRSAYHTTPFTEIVRNPMDISTLLTKLENGV
jgi:hypothetical protein